MQSCPFCNFDAGDRPLLDGRCPQCGNILQWSEIEIQAASPQANTSPSDATEIDAHSNELNAEDSSYPDEAAGEVSHAEREVSLERQPTHFAENNGLHESDEATPASQLTQNPQSRSDTPSLVAKIWRDSVDKSLTKKNTLKAEKKKETTVSDSVFSIQTRDVRPATGTPSASLDYELLEIIGQGGVGVVYSARQASIDRNVALKMLREEFGYREEHRDKFLAEAVLTGELDHPNIVPIYDLGRSSSGELFYSMKNVVGTPWDRVINSKSLRENLDILLKVSDAVAFAHSRGVLHRDLKPENVMLGNYGEVLVMDWGIALPTAGFRKSASILRSQAMGGTPAYMAPEMAKGPFEAIGQASDVYLLGAILFEILTQVPPHDGHDVMDCLENAARNIIRPTEVTGELMDIATKAMSTIPGRRYRKVIDFQTAVRQYQSHSESILLSDKAETELASALQSKEYQGFSQAVFAFQESLNLWSDNESAREGLSRAKLAYAQVAHEKEDYELGLSLLDPQQPEHARLLGDLKKKMQERNARQARLRSFRRVAVGLVATIVIGGMVTTGIIFKLYRDSEKNRVYAESQKEEANKQTQQAEKEREEAMRQRQAALLLQQEAERQKREAVVARHNTELARLESIAERRRAEESAYLAETGLIGASLTQNSFTIAKSILQLQAESPSKAKLRHWEWGRFQYIVQGGMDADHSSVTTHATTASLVAMDATPDASLVAVGLGNGECELWGTERLAKWATGRVLFDIAMHPSGNVLVTCGLDEAREPTVRLWTVRGNQPPELLREHPMDRQPTTLAFSNSGSSDLLVIGDDRNSARVWNWRDNRDLAVFLGHNDVVTDAQFSPDDRWVATASLDGSVRIFNATTAEESQRFTGHEGRVWSLAFAPDGKAIASGGDDQRILIWPVNAGTGPSTVERVKSQVARQPLPETPFLALAGHTSTIRDLRFSRLGDRLASAANDNTICIWPLNTKEQASGNSVRSMLDSLLDGSLAVADATLKSPHTQLRGHGGWVHTCLFNRDGNRLLSGGDDYTWRSWEIDQVREYYTLDSGGPAIVDVDYHPDGTRIVMALSDGSIQVWDSRQQKLLQTLKQGHDYLLSRVAVSPDDHRLITAAGDNTLRVWDLARGSQERVMEHAGRNAFFAVSRDWRWLVTTGDNLGVAVWDLSQDQVPLRLRAASRVSTVSSSSLKGNTFNEPNCVAISNDGRYIAIGDKDGRCEFWDASSQTKLHTISGHADSIVATFFVQNNADDTPIFLSVGADGTVAWWNASSGEELPRERLVHNAALHLAVPDAEFEFLATAAMLGNGTSRLWLWNLKSGELLDRLDLDGKTIQDVSFKSQGGGQPIELLVTTSDAQSSAKVLMSWHPGDVKPQAINNPQMLTASVWGAAPTHDNQHLIVYGGRGAKLWKNADSRPIMQYRPSSSATAVAVSPDGKMLASGNEDGSCILWDLEQAKPLGTLINVHQSTIHDIAFSPNGQQLASVCQDGILGVWSPQAMAPIAQFALETSIAINSVNYSADGKLLAITANDELVRVHETDTFKQVLKLEGHVGVVRCASFSPDGAWLATGGDDKSIRIWSVESGNSESVLMGHSAAITSLDISSDGQRLLSGSRDTACKLWDIAFLSQGSEPGSGEGLGALLTLEQHQSEIVKTSFSPKGLEIITASTDGQLFVWPSSDVNIAIRLSSTALSYPLANTPVPLDRSALVSHVDPDGLANATLRITVAGDENDPDLPVDFIESLNFDTGDGLLEQQADTLIWTATQQPVAEIIRQSPSVLELKFAANINQAIGQQIVRRLQYRATCNSPSSLAGQTRIVLFELLDERGRTGNAQPEALVINLLEPSSEPAVARLSEGQAQTSRH